MHNLCVCCCQQLRTVHADTPTASACAAQSRRPAHSCSRPRHACNSQGRSACLSLWQHARLTLLAVLYPPCLLTLPQATAALARAQMVARHSTSLAGRDRLGLTPTMPPTGWRPHQTCSSTTCSAGPCSDPAPALQPQLAPSAAATAPQFWAALQLMPRLQLHRFSMPQRAAVQHPPKHRRLQQQ